MRVEDIGPPLAVTDTVDATVFEAYLERVLLPHLRPGRIMMMDNLSAHKSERVGKLIEGVGREPVDLPSYSPDFNPIEGPSPRRRASYVRQGLEPARLWWRR